MAKTTINPSSFTLCLPGVSLSPVPPWAVVLRSPLVLSITVFRRGSFFSPSPLSAARRGYPVLPMVRRLHSGLSPHPIQWVGANGGQLRANPALGILVYPSSPGLAYIQTTSFIEKIFQVYTWGRHGLSFYRGTGFGLVPRMC